MEGKKFETYLEGINKNGKQYNIYLLEFKIPKPIYKIKKIKYKYKRLGYYNNKMEKKNDEKSSKMILVTSAKQTALERRMKWLLKENEFIIEGYLKDDDEEESILSHTFKLNKDKYYESVYMELKKTWCSDFVYLFAEERVIEEEESQEIYEISKSQPVFTSKTDDLNIVTFNNHKAFQAGMIYMVKLKDDDGQFSFDSTKSYSGK